MVKAIATQATEGVDLVQQLMSAFPDNAILIQFFAYFNTSLFFIETSRKQIENIRRTLASSNVPDEVIQVAGEDLGDLLGRVLEVKLKVERLISRLE
ncbi:hypothetical protein PJF56_15240 [Roseofilum sp. BLCC_M91]|uniref:Restriction endonuclease subunit S n=1 Tax=Roseofilum halophilum BLCC-M91 TaxID=3022259 RepID=A0ABT7BN68_9CYAN|nr:hypothetical protein [Roseofilum halophilum]MDJ1180217.1 hypothetical protein [Roseofilum halophilum BLCC-M91]